MTAFVLAAILLFSPVAATSPVAKVVQLLTNLEAKVTKEGEEAQATYNEYSEWCRERSANIGYDIKTNAAQVEGLKADIEKATATIESLGAKIEDTGSAISTSDADLKAATKIRETEASDFVAEEKELHDVVSALERAIGVLEREARKGGSALVQFQKAKKLSQVFRIMVDASMIQSDDGAKLTALVQDDQSQQDDDFDDDASAGAPDAAAYESHSTSILDVLKDLLDKAKDQLGDLQKQEANSRHNFEMLKQSLTDEIRFGTQDMNEAQQAISSQKENKAGAEGDLAVTSKTLAEDQKTEKTLEQDCFAKSRDFEASKKSRGEELKALAEAKQVLVANTGGAADVAYSFLQLDADGDRKQSSLRTGVDLVNFEAVQFIRNLAREQHSDELVQLSRNMAAAMKAESSGGDPFVKVRGLIVDMLNRLQQDAEADATHKAYCDKELGETLSKKESKTANIDKLSTQIDAMSASSAQLKEQVAGLQTALAKLASSQAETTAMRRKEKEQFKNNEAELKQGLEGIKVALQVLREYYAKDTAHSAAEGASTGIIGLLEVVQSDFSMSLAEMSATEASAQRSYDADTRENEIEKATKEQDVKYKTKEGHRLNSAVAEATSDRTGVQAELSAILDYKAHLQQMCVAKPETYSERKGRREAELAGLKEALKILEGESVFLQRGLRGRRGHHAHYHGSLHLRSRGM